MIDFYEQRELLDKLRDEVVTLGEAMSIDSLIAKVAELKEEQAKEDFWTNIEAAQKVNQQLTNYSRRIKKFQDLSASIESTVQLLDLIEELDEAEEEDKAKKVVNELAEKVEELSIEALLRGKYDGCNAILTLHAGAGGTEAQDWTEMLYRMYSRYAERNGYKLRELDFLDGESAGLKSVTFEVAGENAYGYLKAEMGVHRLVRISPFDANKRRHTSFASLEVMPLIDENDEIEIDDDDIRIDTYRSGGAGGQHVNKTDSAVRITHIPSGIVVQCQNERSQVQNKETAFKMLKSKLLELRERERMQEAQNIKGDLKRIEWGSQIRSYVFCPYTMVKDHRTNYEKTNVTEVMDGDIGEFIIEYLKRS